MAKSGHYTKLTQLITRWIVYHRMKDMQEIELTPSYQIEVWTSKNISPESLIEDIKQFSQLSTNAFGKTIGMKYDEAAEYLMNFVNTVVVIREDNSHRIVGYSIAEPSTQVYPDNDLYTDRKPTIDTAYLTITVIAPSKRGQHLFEHLELALKTELIVKGFEYLEIDASAEVADGKESFADKIIKNNSNRIVETKIHNSPLGKQMYILE